ncbi:carbohydrate kinase [Tamlana nanhaiensis]|uniref:Carbohydrate kinase n=1 Tax=Neotamlana nanhaiensis TaxID=1382798 RepID=A0A0D7W0N1_9FLAO|nr:carbohydrate kinase [Tamlana nanhaiensis]KJD31392.1 carbohydrate kinase [Tamlana nanhaiensis]
MANIVCFGEVLWDVFPTHKKIGGAPLNVALRLNAFGNLVNMISSVGNDSDGKQIIDYIEASGITSNYIQISDVYKTSHVNVVLNAQGAASYTIDFPCAWDDISLNNDAVETVKLADAFIFGSLVTRNDTSYKTLNNLLKYAKFKVFDVNLRPPHYTMTLLLELMEKADFIKFNDEELQEICEYFGFKSSNLEAQIAFITKKTNTSTVCVTLGGEGAIYFVNNKFYRSLGYKVTVQDTVGAGDSFLATLINEILNNTAPLSAINKACAVGALVASKDGANPKITSADIEYLMRN